MEYSMEYSQFRIKFFFKIMMFSVSLESMSLMAIAVDRLNVRNSMPTAWLYVMQTGNDLILQFRDININMSNSMVQIDDPWLL
jgi:hypothetical protein